MTAAAMTAAAMTAIVERGTAVAGGLPRAARFDPGIAKPVCRAGRAGLVVELPDVYDDTHAVAEHWLADGRRRLDGRVRLQDRATRPPDAVLAALARTLPRDGIRARTRDATLDVASSRLTLVQRDGWLEVRSAAAPVDPAALQPLRSWVPALTAGARLARLHVAPSGARALGRLPLAAARGRVAGEALGAALAVIARAVARLEHALPGADVIGSPGFAELLAIVLPAPAELVMATTTKRLTTKG